MRCGGGYKGIEKTVGCSSESELNGEEGRQSIGWKILLMADIFTGDLKVCRNERFWRNILGDYLEPIEPALSLIEWNKSMFRRKIIGNTVAFEANDLHRVEDINRFLTNSEKYGRIVW